MASKKTTLTLAVTSALGATLLTAASAQAADPFEMRALDRGYQVAELDKGARILLADNKAKEGKCGGDKAKEGKCGGDKAKEGKCGGDKAKEGSGKKKEGKCGEGKCGEGKCGGSKK